MFSIATVTQGVYNIFSYISCWFIRIGNWYSDLTELRYMTELIAEGRWNNENILKLVLFKDMSDFSFTGVELEWDRNEMYDNEFWLGRLMCWKINEARKDPQDVPCKTHQILRTL